MEETADRLFAGDFEYENGSLDFSCSKLEIVMEKGECPEGSFTVLGAGGRPCEGSVAASDGRMECLNTKLSGNREEIFYRFHGEDLEEGDVVKGEFYVISNQGEHYLPFVVTVEHKVLSSSVGSVKSLFAFANLAKANPREAVALFYSKDFARVFAGGDRQYYEYYLGMSSNPGNEQNVEEFLIGTGRKQKAEYRVDVEEVRLEDPKEETEVSFTLTKNGWGYTRIWLDAEGDFLRCEREQITEEDFVGGSCRITVPVDRTRLHAGNNLGAIRLWSVYGEIRIPVKIKNRGAGRHRLDRRRLILQLMEFYQAFRLKKISASTWQKESTAIVEKFTAENDRDILARLFQAQLLITGERYNEAQWILDHVADMLDALDEENAVQEAYYLYLTSLIHREGEYVDQVTERVEYLYKKYPGEWPIAWLLLYLSEEYNRSFTRKWMFLEEQFERGASSPVLYIEALLLLNLNPSLLTKLGRFERQLLLYGARHEALGEDVVGQLVYLAQKEREYSLTVYRTLKLCYGSGPDDGVLREICSILIKGNRVGSRYFEWYSLGVERQLRITRLYEYYMMSVDMDSVVELPRIVLMYFSYQNSLSYERAAYLYANVHRSREELPELYETYLSRMEEFVVEQILKRRINRDLAYLYKNLLRPDMITKEVAQALAELIFVHLVQVSGGDMRFCMVCRHGVTTGKRYPVVAGRAFVPIPGAGDKLIFEDAFGNLYMTGVSYTIEKLMLPGKLVKQISPMAGDVQDLNLYMCLSGHETAEVTDENAQRFGYLIADGETQSGLKREAGIKLLQYYYESDRIQELDEYLTAVEPDVFSRKERGELLRYLVVRGMDEKAYGWLARFGPYGADPMVLVRLCTHRIADAGMEEDACLTEALLYAFGHGKYNETGLRYLILYGRGLTRKLRDIFKAAEDFDMDTYELCERMLLQMLFTGSFVGEKMKIFKAYVSRGGKYEVETAFLTRCSHEYFVKDQMTDRFVIDEIKRLYKQGEEVGKACRLAVVKYHAENRRETREDDRAILLSFIREMLSQHIRLKMFAEFTDLEDPLIDQLQESTIVEYRAKPGARAIIHYCVERSEGEESTYRTEEMQEVYGGVCFKEFILFFGERLQYYIVEETEGKEQLTESATIQKSDTAGSSDGKFNLINDISISNTLKDYGTVDRLLAEFMNKEYMTKGLFRLS